MRPINPQGGDGNPELTLPSSFNPQGGDGDPVLIPARFFE